ncbi:PREDICTED: uncharacterized protein LOC105964196 [Erythranthe guttata]|uniref:uncharacterized protein LOC105964196 n=1 Tax=Erythranthe guttata TaxID=4155 RepID=UPI00064DDEE9|nr:PREDICTED: uncharacterized protein LOC105964196 [Erythranthe guttata]|eukprot:XP_012844176.1 PREDICTED: uncharacterized protein LOC105964196 [Erythranthe guttata]
MAANLIKILKFCTFSIFVACTAAMASQLSASPAAAAAAVRGAYFPSWAEDFGPSSINTKLFTHIYYAFINPSNVTFKFEIDPAESLRLLNFTSSLRGNKPPPKSLFSVGGSGEARNGVGLFRGGKLLGWVRRYDVGYCENWVRSWAWASWLLLLGCQRRLQVENFEKSFALVVSLKNYLVNK